MSEPIGEPPPMTFKAKWPDRRRIEADARRAGMSVGSYIRSRLLDEPQTKTVYRRTQTKKLITKFIGELGRVGNNMNQIAWKQNSGQVLTPLDIKRHEEGVRAILDIRTSVITFMLNGPC